MSDYSIKPYTTTVVIAVALGIFGGHRFYVGRTFSGVVFLATAGFAGFGWFLDLFQLFTGNFTDSQGKYIRPMKNTRKDRKED